MNRWKNAEVTSQMAQINTVSGITKLQETIEASIQDHDSERSGKPVSPCIQPDRSSRCWLAAPDAVEQWRRAGGSRAAQGGWFRDV